MKGIVKYCISKKYHEGVHHCRFDSSCWEEVVCD